MSATTTTKPSYDRSVLENVITQIRMNGSLSTPIPIRNGEDLLNFLFRTLEKTNFAVKIKTLAGRPDLSAPALEFVREFIYPDAQLDSSDDFADLSFVDNQHFKDAIEILKDLKPRLQPFNPPLMDKAEFAKTVEKILRLMKKPILKLDIRLVSSPGLKLASRLYIRPTATQKRCTPVQTAIYNILFSLHTDKKFKYLINDGPAATEVWDFISRYVDPDFERDYSTNLNVDEAALKAGILELKTELQKLKKPKSVLPPSLICFALVSMTVVQLVFDSKDATPGCNTEEITEMIEGFNKPECNIVLPEGNFTFPEEITISEFELAVPEGNVTIPEFNISLAKEEIELPEDLCSANNKYLVTLLVSLVLRFIITVICTVVSFDELTERFDFFKNHPRFAVKTWVILAILNLAMTIPLGIFYRDAMNARDSLDFDDATVALIETHLNIPEGWSFFVVAVLINILLSILSGLQYDDLKELVKKLKKGCV